MRLLALVLLCVCGMTACVTPAAHVQTAPTLPDDGTHMVDVRGRWLRVLDEGQGTSLPIVFVHGYGSRLEAWKLVQPHFADGRRTISFDQRGFGFSERADGAYGPEAHAADIIGLLDALHIEKAILVGHSYGTGVVVRAALRHPERVAGVVLVSPYAFEEQIHSLFRWARVPGLGEYLWSSSYGSFPGEKYMLAFHDRARFVSLAAMEEATALMEREGSSYAALATVRGMDYGDVEHDYSKITMPFSIVWGESDRVVPIRNAHLFTEAFAQAKLVRVPDCGHMPLWEHPDVVIAAIADVVHKVEADAVPSPSAAPGAQR